MILLPFFSNSLYYAERTADCCFWPHRQIFRGERIYSSFQISSTNSLSVPFNTLSWQEKAITIAKYIVALILLFPGTIVSTLAIGVIVIHNTLTSQPEQPFTRIVLPKEKPSHLPSFFESGVSASPMEINSDDYLSQLPVETQVHVFGFLGSDIKTMRQMSRQLNQVSIAEVIYQSFPKEITDIIGLEKMLELPRLKLPENRDRTLLSVTTRISPEQMGNHELMLGVDRARTSSLYIRYEYRSKENPQNPKYKVKTGVLVLHRHPNVPHWCIGGNTGHDCAELRRFFRFESLSEDRPKCIEYLRDLLEGKACSIPSDKENPFMMMPSSIYPDGTPVIKLWTPPPEL